MKRLFFLLPIFVCLSGFLTGCKDDPGTDGGNEAASSGTPVIQSANYPLHFFATTIGGSHVDARFIAPGDEDPAFWEPSDEEISAIQKADIILMNGATYSKWLKNVSLPKSKLVDTSVGFKAEYIETEGHTHSHAGDDEAHSHGGTAFTTWIDLKKAKAQATAVRDAILAKTPEGAHAEINANADALFGELDSLDADLEAVAKSIGYKALVGSHPVYQYLSERYGLKIKAVHWEPETVPDDKAMADLAKVMKVHPASWMIWEGDPAGESVEKLKAIDVKSIVFDPCGNSPDKGDFLTVMRQNIENLKSIAE
ncbi:MAG: zinc ABC transporter substrate-binding protein [Verrucomicrobiales bacterium]|nr:zinc ABC transporter substrate-binding protein [Verrucomicrobiales bacterium]